MICQVPPAAYPSTMGNETNEGSLQPRHHVYAIDYYSSVRRVIRLYLGPLLEYPLREQTMNPQTSKSKDYLIKRLNAIRNPNTNFTNIMLRYKCSPRYKFEQIPTSLALPRTLPYISHKSSLLAS